MFKRFFGGIFAFIVIGQYRHEAKWEKEGGQDQERSVSWDSNSGYPKCSGAICWHTAQEANYTFWIILYTSQIQVFI